MSIATPFQGSLFANDFICESIVGTPDWKVIADSELDTFGASVRDVFNGFPIASSPNESQTENDLIWPVLTQLGWTASLRQQNLSAHGPGGRARWSAVRGRCREGPCQRFYRGMEALRVRPRGRRVQAMEAPT